MTDDTALGVLRVILGNQEEIMRALATLHRNQGGPGHLFWADRLQAKAEGTERMKKELPQYERRTLEEGL